MREDDASQSHLVDLAQILKARWLAMFAAYVDESGQDQAGLFIIAGYVFSPKQGSKFERSWSKVLSRWGISELHMKDLTRFAGEFRGWNDRHRSSFLSSLTEIIHKRAEFHVIVAIDSAALSELSKQERNILWGAKKYAIVSSYFFGEVAKRISQDDPIAFLFDIVPDNFGKNIVEEEFYNLRRMGKIASKSSIGWFDSKSYEGIQAADFLAYEAGRAYARQLDRATYPQRLSGSRLIADMEDERRQEGFVGEDRIQIVLDKVSSDPSRYGTLKEIARLNRQERKRG